MVVALQEAHRELEDDAEDENGPFQILCLACRTGDVSTAQQAIIDGADVNQIDSFDYSPLILTSLCGHFDMVRLLLGEGATCEGSAGERCLYNALNDRIRNLLLEYDYSKSSDPNIAFSKHVSSLYSKPAAAAPCQTSDLKLAALDSSGRNVDLHAHKFIVAARCPIIAEETEILKGSDFPDCTAEFLDYILRYIYLYDIPEKISPEVQASLKSFQLFELLSHAEKQGPGPDRRPKKRALVERAQNDFLKFYEDRVLKASIRHQSSSFTLKGVGCGSNIFADIILRAESEDNDDGTVAFYPAHRAMLRCDYFDTMFKSGFRESHWADPNLESNADELPVLKVMMAPKILELVLMWFYTDYCDITIPIALDLLYAADMLFIDALKLKAAGVLATAGWSTAWRDRILHGDDELGFSIFDVVRAGWQLRIRRLEEFGAKFLAEHLENILEKGTKLSTEFEDLIKESAARITEREDTDTIEIIDDMRFYLSERFRMRQEDLMFSELIEEAEPAATAAETSISDTENGLAAPQSASDTESSSESPSTVNGVSSIAENGVTDDIKLQTSTLMYEELTAGLDEILEKLSLDA